MHMTAPSTNIRLRFSAFHRTTLSSDHPQHPPPSTMIMTTFANVFFTVCSFFLLAFGGPVPRKALDVYVPPITYPHAGLSLP